MCVFMSYIVWIFQLPACLNVSISGLVTSIVEKRAIFLLPIIRKKNSGAFCCLETSMFSSSSWH